MARQSALDAVELMSIGYEFRREHLRLATRVHYVITNGGDQPNVVPPNAAIWFYFREADYDHIMNLWRIGDNMAKAATLMTDTNYTERLLGTAWPGYFNKPLAEDMHKNMEKVGLPQWSDDDQALAKALQKELKVPVRGLATTISPLRQPRAQAQSEDEGGVGPTGGPSDDIGDISWNVPTVTLGYPSNIPGGPGHNWANANFHGDAHRAQGRGRWRQSAGHDHSRYSAASRNWFRAPRIISTMSRPRT